VELLAEALASAAIPALAEFPAEALAEAPSELLAGDAIFPIFADSFAMCPPVAGPG
jgi:hypothetical protein